MRVLMVGVSPDTRGGMWSVAECECGDARFRRETNCKYIPMATRGSFPKKITFAFFAFLKVFFHLLFRRPDLVHCHMSERGSVVRKRLVLELAKVFGCRTVLHLHGAELEQWYRDGSPLVKRLVRTTLERADCILLLGRYQSPFMEELGVRERCRVLHNGVFCPEENAYRDTAKDLLFLGAIGERKGAFDLLEAFRQALPDLPAETTLQYYGTGETERLEQRIRELGLEGRVFCRGWLDREALPSVLRKTALHVLPSYHEGLPMSILETMAYGVPTLSTDVAAIPEVIDGTNGVLVTPGDLPGLSAALTELTNDENRRIALGEAAFQTIRTGFSTEAHVRRLLKYYRDMI